MSAKMDGVYTRTPQQLEEKLNYNKRFAKVMGIATDARDAADEAKKSVSQLDSELTAEEVYNRLTNNGESQGLFRDDKGNLLVNGEYIYALEKLFAKDINMSGKFTHTVKVFLEPDQHVIDDIQGHLLGTAPLPESQWFLYDFNGDGQITIADLASAQRAALGNDTLANWSGAVESTVTLTIDLSNPKKCIRIQGHNMWGKYIDNYVGVDDTNIRQKGLADYVVEAGTYGAWTYQKWNSGIAECWGEVFYSPTSNIAAGGEVRAPFDFPFAFAKTPFVFIHAAGGAYRFDKAYPIEQKITGATAYGKLEETVGLTSSESVSFMVKVKGTWK